MSYVQRAHGDFTIAVSGPFHCGPDHTSPKQFTYEVELHYPADALDSNGFLLDNLTFKQYFHDLGCTSLSCEKLARKAAEDLHRMADGRSLKTSVGIWAIPNHAKIEYHIDAKAA